VNPQAGRSGYGILRHLRSIPVVVGVVVAIVLGLGSGVAYGYFTADGSGAGAAGAGTMQTVAVVTGGTPSMPLLPGGPAGDLVFKVANTNDFDVTLAAVTMSSDGETAFDKGHSGCGTTSGHAVVTVQVPADQLRQVIAAKTTVQVELARAVRMDLAATNSCQGATIMVPIVVSVQAL